MFREIQARRRLKRLPSLTVVARCDGPESGGRLGGVLVETPGLGPSGPGRTGGQSPTRRPLGHRRGEFFRSGLDPRRMGQEAVAMGDAVQLEKVHQRMQMTGLLAHRLAGRRRLFDQCRILLGDLVHLQHRSADLLDTAGLFAAGDSNFADQIVDLLHAQQNALQGFAGGVRQPPTFFDLFNAAFNQILDLASRIGAALGQLAHFAGHDRKATPIFAGSRRFHRRVQSQQIGLEVWLLV